MTRFCRRPRLPLASLALLCAGLLPHGPAAAQDALGVAFRVGGQDVDPDQQLVLLPRLEALEITASAPAGAEAPMPVAGGPGPGLVRAEPAMVAVELTAGQRLALDPPPIGEEAEAATEGRAHRAALLLLAPVEFDRLGPGVVDGAVIGIYPDETASTAPSVVQRNSANYAPPRLLYRLDATTRDLYLNRRATLGMLTPPLLENEAGAPRYVAVSPRLLQFWDALCDAADEAGPGAAQVRVLRGFVTPFERQRLEALGVAIAPYSRHLYGDALALVLDADGDGRMDDMNADGHVNIADADVLAAIVEDALSRTGMDGGLGVEAAFGGPAHVGTPYVHVDLRGWRERWRQEGAAASAP